MSREAQTCLLAEQIRTVSGNLVSPAQANARRSNDVFTYQARWLAMAVDAESGRTRWKVAVTNPILAGVTPTAGGLVFTSDLGGHVYAFDAEGGRVLWETDTGQSIGGGVIAYLAGGRELIGIASGMRSPTWPGGEQQSRIVVYGLK